ncbi:MAG: hypothetical protein ACRDQW_17775 [Haloechinothrix sp.]
MSITAVVSGAASGADRLAESQSADLKPTVERLIRELDADRLAVRVQAERDLIALGPGVLAHLPAPDRTPNASVREAIRRIRVALERRKARDSVLPARVTLRSELPLEEAIERIVAQTGNRLDVSGLPARLRETPFEVDYRSRSFWSALDDLARQAKFRYRYDASADVLRLLPRAETGAAGELAVDRSGPYRLSVVSAGLRPLFGDDAHRLLRVRLRFFAEPRLRPLFLKFAADDVTARAPAGRRLEPFTPKANRELPFGEGGREIELDANFKVPRSLAFETIAFRGTMAIQTAAGSERIEFARLDEEGEGTAQRRGGVTVTLQKARFVKSDEGSRRARIRIAVSYDTGGPAFESHRTWIFHNKAFLETKAGRRIEPTGPFTTTLQADGAVAVEYTFADLKGTAGDFRFVYVAPTLLIEVPVEFELEDVPVSAP